MQIVIIAVLVLALLPFIYYLLSLYCVIAYFRGARKVQKTQRFFHSPRQHP